MGPPPYFNTTPPFNSSRGIQDEYSKVLENISRLQERVFEYGRPAFGDILDGNPNHWGWFNTYFTINLY